MIISVETIDPGGRSASTRAPEAPFGQIARGLDPVTYTATAPTARLVSPPEAGPTSHVIGA